jgi:flagellar biosynthesis chaperone FliJ
MMGMNLTITKFKNLKIISHHLWNISKYFSKLIKQLEAKEKKGASSKQISIIRNFLQSYDSHRTILFDWKTPQRVEKEVGDLKQKVSNLKGLMKDNE